MSSDFAAVDPSMNNTCSGSPSLLRMIAPFTESILKKLNTSGTRSFLSRSAAITAPPCVVGSPLASVTRMKSSRSGSVSALVRKYADRPCTPGVIVKRGVPLLKASESPIIATLRRFSSSAMSTRDIVGSVLAGQASGTKWGIENYKARIENFDLQPASRRSITARA